MKLKVKTCPNEGYKGNFFIHSPKRGQMKPSVQIALIIVAGIILLTLILIFTLTSVFSSSKDSLQVNGQSTIKVTPDLITLSYNVETKGNTSKEAENLNSDIVKD